MPLSKQSDLLYKECIALAGIFQAVHLVDQIANQGQCNEEALATCLRSVTVLDPPTIESVYAGEVNYLPGLAIGFTSLEQVLQDKKAIQPHILRYIMGLLHLQKKLRRSNERLEIMRSRLEQITRHEALFTEDLDNLSDRLAGIYEDTVSTFNYRIHVNGNRLYLENPKNVKRIRALLLAGIRAVMLWHQVGGSRWHLLMKRAKLLQVVRSLN